MIEAAQSVTATKTTSKFSYETGNSGAWKTWHVSPHASTKGGGNNGGGYYGSYATQTD